MQKKTKKNYKIKMSTTTTKADFQKVMKNNFLNFMKDEQTRFHVLPNTSS